MKRIDTDKIILNVQEKIKDARARRDEEWSLLANQVVGGETVLPHMKSLRPKIVCICGSSRFCDIAAVTAWTYEKSGVIALGMHLLPAWYGASTGKTESHHWAEEEGVAQILDELHLKKIEMADLVHVVNHGGYIGAHTRIEIEHAQELGKPIVYQEEAK